MNHYQNALLSGVAMLHIEWADYQSFCGKTEMDIYTLAVTVIF